MAKAYSEDLRIRGVRAVIEEGLGYPETATRYGVSEASVRRWVKQYKTEGDVKPKPNGGGRPRSLDPATDYPIVEGIVTAQPDLTYHEIHRRFNDTCEKNASYAVVVRAVLKLGFRRKKRPRSLNREPRGESKD